MKQLGEKGEQSVLIVVLLVGSMMITFTTFLSFYFSSMSTASADIEKSFARKEITISSTIWENQDGDIWDSYVPHSKNNNRVLDYGDSKFWIDIVEDRRSDTVKWYYQLYPVDDETIYSNGIPVNLERLIDGSDDYKIYTNIGETVEGGFWEKLLFGFIYSGLRGEPDLMEEGEHRAINIGNNDRLHIYVEDLVSRENVGGANTTTHYETGTNFIHYEYSGDSYDDVSTERGEAYIDSGYANIVFTMNREPVEVGSQIGFKKIVLGLFSFSIPKVPTVINAIVTSIVWIMLSYALYTLVKGIIPLL